MKVGMSLWNLSDIHLPFILKREKKETNQPTSKKYSLYTIPVWLVKKE